jgi:hypothetical protein
MYPATRRSSRHGIPSMQIPLASPPLFSTPSPSHPPPFPHRCAQSDKDTRQDILKVFDLFDVEKKGKISIRDLKRVAKELGETMTEAELMEMIERADTDADGEVTAEDFYNVSEPLFFPFELLAVCIRVIASQYCIRPATLYGGGHIESSLPPSPLLLSFTCR